MKEELKKECREVIKMLLSGYANGMTDLQIAKAFNTLKKLDEKTMKEVSKENEQAFAIHNVSGRTVTEVRQRELGEYDFYCSKCKTVHTKSAYAIAQAAMNVRLVFTCTCGNKIDL